MGFILSDLFSIPYAGPAPEPSSEASFAKCKWLAWPCCLLSSFFKRGNLKENCHEIEKRVQSLHLITTKGKPLT